MRVYNYALSEGEILEIVPEPDDCPDTGDTHCAGLQLTGPADNSPGTYVVSVTDALDDSGDPILYTFVAAAP